MTNNDTEQKGTELTKSYIDTQKEWDTDVDYIHFVSYKGNHRAILDKQNYLYARDAALRNALLGEIRKEVEDTITTNNYAPYIDGYFNFKNFVLGLLDNKNHYGKVPRKNV